MSEKDIQQEYIKSPTSNINFGISVLNWIKYGDKPRFNNLHQEIINNKQSTIDEERYNTLETESKIKIRNYPDEYYLLNEMFSLKLYTDTTTYTAYLRKAFWTSSSTNIKKSFYWWAITLYKTHLFHSKPIQVQSNLETPRTLFHGLFILYYVYM